jgi:membrane-bound lytic murein transglycosylase D
MTLLQKLLPIVIASLMASVPAQAVNPFVRDSVTRADVDPVVVSLDSMSYQLFTRDKLFGTNADIEKSINISRDQLPTYTVAEMKERMKMIPSMISMDYNPDVQAFIDLFVYRKRGLMTQLLASSQIYFPLFEAELDRNNMPDELKYLPVIESALNPQAVSSAGATGLWQMMYGTGKMMGLEGSSYYDERRDPVKSTQAGVKYLKQLYDLYGDWQLALAAYNSGPGYVNKAIARSGGVKNFWAIKNYLPAETRSYVPTFLAVVYAMHYHKDYKLVSAEPKRELYAVDTVMIEGKVTLKHIAQTLGMPVEELQFLNPSLKAGIIPQVKNGYPLNLPVNYFASFEAKREALMNDPEITAQASASDAYANPTMVRVARYIYYKVRRADNISTIAARYGVSVAEIREWNRMRNNYVVRNQNLKILTFVEVPVYQAQTATPAKAKADTGATAASTDTTEQVLYYYEKGNTDTTHVVKAPAAKKPVITAAQSKAASIRYYRVQSGDSLWSITQHYPGLTIDKLKADNRISGRSLLKGQVLKIIM